MIPACSQSCRMMLLCWFTLLLFLSASAEFNTVWRDSGENVTLQCSSAGCSSSTEGYDGMYLYLTQDDKERKEVLYYHPDPGSTDKITPGFRYRGRIETSGTLRNHTITISTLSVDDSGFYSCVFFTFPSPEVECSVYTLFIRGVAPCPRSAEVSLDSAMKNPPPLELGIIITSCSISALMTLILIVLIVPKVRRCSSSRRRTTSSSHVPSNNVYEVMTKNSLPPAPEQSSFSSCGCA